MAAFPRPHRHRNLNHLIAAALAAAVLTACGGGGGGDAPFSSFQSADVVIGQADFTGTDANQGGSSADANTLSQMFGNAFVNDAGGLFIGDSGNNRVLGYDSVPTVNNQTADFVLGQPDFTTTTAETTRSGMDQPQQVVSTGGKLIVADFQNARILVYNGMPAGNTDPDVVVGQSDFTSSSTTCDNTHLFGPATVAATPSGKLIVTDRSHNRVLIWNSVPTTNGEPADVVLGQADFTHCTANDDDQNGTSEATPSNRTMDGPGGIWANDDKLVVSDSDNNRVLIWNGIPNTDFAPADVVLGQGNFTHNTENDDDQDGNADGGPTARTLNAPFGGVDSNGTRLAVADQGNNRVLIWNSFPTRNFAPADVVLGQGDFTHNTANDADQDSTADGSASANVLDTPEGVYLDQDKLLVSDSQNHRVLIFNSQ